MKAPMRTEAIYSIMTGFIYLSGIAALIGIMLTCNCKKRHPRTQDSLFMTNCIIDPMNGLYLDNGAGEWTNINGLYRFEAYGTNGGWRVVKQ